jgi:hypothetical protein
VQILTSAMYTNGSMYTSYGVDYSSIEQLNTHTQSWGDFEATGPTLI